MDTFENAMSDVSVTFRCDHCHQKLHAAENLFGHAMRCPRCKGEVAVPALGTPAKIVELPPAEEAGSGRPRKFFAPTDKQIEFAESLGVHVPAGIGRFDLSRLIDEALGKTGDEPAWLGK
jgi:hypothetical protein